MMTRRFGFAGGALLALMCAGAVACSDDNDAPTGEGGGAVGGGNTGGSRAGTGGSSPTEGGAANGGEAGSGPVVGGEGGSGGESGNGAMAGAAGEGGAAGSGGSEPAPAVISKLSDEVYPQASDLRGLYFTDDGKLYASGHLGTNTTVDKKVVVARFDQDGSPDPTFGEGGFVQLNLVEQTVDTEAEPDVVTNDGNEESLGIVELDSGELLVQVTLRDENGKGTDVGLLKLSAAGEPVTTFGTNGLKRLVFGWDPADDATWPTGVAGPNDAAWGLELDNSTATEKVVVFGFGPAAKGQLSGTGAAAVQRTDNDRYVLRVLTSDGSVDPAFNGGKVFALNSAGTFGDGGRRGLVETDGSILSAGYTNFGATLGNHVLAFRLTPAGVLDTTFGALGQPLKGVARTNPFVNDGGQAESYQFARQSNGRLISVGYGSATGDGFSSSYEGYVSTTGPDMISLALTADGKALDTTFGVLGTRVIQSEEAALASSEDRGRDVIALADDRVVIAGRYGTDPALFVLEADGSFDPVNGVGHLFRYSPLGTEQEPPVATSHFFRVAQSKDGTRVAASTSNHVDGVLLAVLKVEE